MAEETVIYKVFDRRHGRLCSLNDVMRERYKQRGVNVPRIGRYFATTDFEFAVEMARIWCVIGKQTEVWRVTTTGDLKPQEYCVSLGVINARKIFELFWEDEESSSLWQVARVLRVEKTISIPDCKLEECLFVCWKEMKNDG